MCASKTRVWIEQNGEGLSLVIGDVTPPMVEAPSGLPMPPRRIENFVDIEELKKWLSEKSLPISVCDCTLENPGIYEVARDWLD